jgi:CDP-diglyceride synthetase
MVPKQSWEGTILAFVLILTVLVGIGYTLAMTYLVNIPWPILVLAALLGALGLRFRRRLR